MQGSRFGAKCLALDGRSCEDRIGTGPPRARTEVIHVDLKYWAISQLGLYPLQRESGELKPEP